MMLGLNEKEQTMNKTIWAPWRIEYILGDKVGGCFLCKMFAEENDSAKCLPKRTTATTWF